MADDSINGGETVRSTELIRTSQSWDGVEMPDYLQGRPELRAGCALYVAGIIAYLNAKEPEGFR